MLGRLYEAGLRHPQQGQIVRQDYLQALQWFQKAAAQGDADAQWQLGSMYANGKGVPQNYKEAVEWYRRAADQGYRPAQDQLGYIYAVGQGVPRDAVQAYFWWNLAIASLPPGTSKSTRDDRVRDRDRMAKEMTPTQLTRAQELANQWWKAHHKEK
jgi:TPR repeat protein